MKIINEITEHDRSMFDKIDRDCLAMHVLPPPKTFIKLEVHDQYGEKQLEYNLRSRSWVRNAYNVLGTNFLFLADNNGGATYGAGYLNVKKTDGNIANLGSILQTASNLSRSVGGSGITAQGIVVGTGTGAESFEDYKLGTLIANGSGAGQIAYAAQSATTRAYDAGTKKMTAVGSRVFNNNSGGQISVSEVAWCTDCYSSTYIMLCRDLLASAVAVENAAQLTVTYTIELTFPA